MKIASICGAALVVCAGQAASAALYSNFGGTANPTAIGLSSGTLTRSGVAAPAGSEWSELDFGNISNGSSVHRTTAGPNFRIADDFTVPAGGWTLTSAMVYGYQTGSAVGFSVASAANVRIWSGVPDAVGSTIVFGDTSTNRLLAQTNTNLFRIFGTTAPPGGVATVQGTTRTVRQFELDLGGVVLGAGTYWMDYQLAPTTAGSSIFNPSITTTDGSRGFVTGATSRQMTATAWVDILDAGTPGTLPDVAQDVPFILNGVPTPGALSLVGIGGLLAARRRR